VPVSQATKIDPESIHTGILERTLEAYVIAEAAAARVADCLVARDWGCVRAVQEARQELDRRGREVDAAVTAGMVEVHSPAQARDLLSSMKMVIDLERIGDLLVSVSGCACALSSGRLLAEDISDLVKMASVVERMLAGTHAAFLVRDVERAVAVLRADAEVDRHRNLILMRHLELAPSHGAQQAIQVVFMAQALERAGDHIKNLAEEVCHLATGRSVRHLLHRSDKPHEQMYLQYLRNRHGITSGSENPDVRQAEPAPSPLGPIPGD
jgi:phosphate transport system protein